MKQKKLERKLFAELDENEQKTTDKEILKEINNIKEIINMRES